MPLGKRRVLSRAITVEGVGGDKYKKNGNYVATRITDGEDDFLDTVSEAFDALQKLPTGQRLIDEIDASGKTCVIFCGSTNRMMLHYGAAILQDVGDKRATVDRYAIPLSDYGTMNISDNMTAGSAITQTEIDQALTARIQKVHTYNDPVMSPTEKAMRADNRAFLVFFNQIARLHGADPEGYIAQRSGVPRDRISDYVFGDKRVNTSDNFSISFGLYEHVLRGKGADTAVRLVPEVAMTSPQNAPTWFQKRRGITSFKKSAGDVRADVMLGHELIHAWRMMTGRRLVAQGWEEEMMTVGIGPGAELEYTENKLRNEAGHPMRTGYPSLSAATLAGNAMHQQHNK